MTAPPPSAAAITLEEALGLLDGPVSGLAGGVGKGLYTFWVGAGISMGRVEGLKQILIRVLDFIRERIDKNDPACPYKAAIDEILVNVGGRSLTQLRRRILLLDD